MNFINPKYTDKNPYEVTITPGYTENIEKTRQLKNVSNRIDSFDKMVEQIITITGGQITDSSKASIEVKISLDYEFHNECQMAIFYENNCVLIETGSNDITDKLLKIMSGQDAIDSSYYIKEYTYQEFKNLFTGTNNDTITKLIKKKEWKWTSSNELLVTETTIIPHTEYKPTDKSAVGSSEECNAHLTTIKKQNGYDEASEKGTDAGMDWWTVEKQNGNVEYYELRYNKGVTRTHNAC